MNHFINIMTAAGAGSRFKSSSKVPKPFVQILGHEAMVDYVMHMTGAKDSPVYLIGQAAHRKHIEMLKYFPMNRVALIPPMIDSGPAGSVIMGMSAITPGSNDMGFLLMDCDSFVDPGPNKMFCFKNIRKKLEDLGEDIQCAVVTVETFVERQNESSVASGYRPWIIEGGVPKGGRVNTGMYWFRSFAEFRKVAFDLWGHIERPVKELKISEIMNQFHLEYGQRVCKEIFLEGADFINLGTPDSLDAYTAGLK